MKTKSEVFFNLLKVCDSMGDVETKLEYTALMIDEVTQEYFDVDTKDLVFLLSERESCRIKANIALDYANKSLKQIREAYVVLDTLLKTLKQQEAHNENETVFQGV